MQTGWFGSSSATGTLTREDSLSSHDDSIPNNERRPLTAGFDHAVSFDDCAEMEDDYGSIPTPNDSKNSGGRSKRGPPLTANNLSSMMDSSHHSHLSQYSTSSMTQTLSAALKDFQQFSTASIRKSLKHMQSAIAEHTGSIGMLGSLAIAINNLTGPAMLSLPATFSRSGIIPTAFTLIFVSVLSALCSLHMANVISKVPLNHDFKQDVEFPEAFRTFWGQNWFILANWLFFACITVLNVSSLVDSAHVMDTFLGHFNPWGGAWALAIDQNNYNVTLTSWNPSVCSEELLYDGGCIPFESTEAEHDGQLYLITAGYAFTAVIFFPMALMDLTENVAWQILGFFVLITISIQFILTFAMSEWDSSHLPWWGDSYDSLLGVVVFNFALVITVPAWLYEKEPHVDIPTVLYTATTSSSVLYLAIGILGCLAMPNVSDNFLESIMSGSLSPAMQIGASTFAFFIIGLNIPLFSILTRLSLVGGGNEARAAEKGNQLCSHGVANILAVYLPFGLSWTLYQGTQVTTLLSWGGMIVTSLVAFVLPLALALYVVETKFDDCNGAVRVYPWGLSDLLSSKKSQVGALKVLLILSILAVVGALAGNIFAGLNGGRFFEGSESLEEENIN